MFKLLFFVSATKWNYISFSFHQKLLWTLSMTIIQDYQFKYISHCLCMFYPEPFLFSAPTLHIIEWKSSSKEFLFVQLFFKPDNISRTTFRGDAWVNDITKNFCAYREISPLFTELFVFSYMSNISLLSGKTKSYEKGIEEISFRRKRMDREFWRFDGSPVDLKFCDIRIMSVTCPDFLIWLKKFSRIRGKFRKCYLPNISDSKIRQSLPSSNIWNAFAKKITFCENNFFHSFHHLLPVPTLVLAAILILWIPSPSG